MLKLLLLFYVLTFTSTVSAGFSASYDAKCPGLDHLKQELEQPEGNDTFHDVQSHCCRGGQLDMEYLEAGAKLKNDCLEEVKSIARQNKDENVIDASIPSLDVSKRLLPCVFECIARKDGILMDNGEHDREKVVTHFRRVFGNHKWKNEVLEEFTDRCFKNMLTIRKLNFYGNAGCNPNPMTFSTCMLQLLITQCPLEQQINSKVCRIMRFSLKAADVKF